MRTIAIQIGNSDDRLTQKEWAAFVQNFVNTIETYGKVHFFGASVNYAEWQNAAWIIEIDDAKIPHLKRHLIGFRQAWRQDSMAWLEGETEFV